MAAADSHAERLELDEALRYMKTVKVSLGNGQPETYRQFVVVMADFKNGKIGVAEVMSRVRALFRDRPDLIVGFNAFLPKCYHIGQSDEQPADIKEPASFVKAVKDRHPEDYGRPGIAEVASRVGELFRDSPGLIAGFHAMLPGEHEIQVVPRLDEHELAALVSSGT